MPINYDAGTNIITVTGYTSSTPCNFTDIYNADVSGGWGKVTKQGTNQFYFICKLQIGDGTTTTWFADVGVQCVWSGSLTTANYQKINTVEANANLRLGICTNDAAKTTKEGCNIVLLSGSHHTFMIWSKSGSNIEYYSTNIIDSSSALRVYLVAYGTSKLYNCVFDHINTNNFSSTNMYNVRVQRGRDGFYTIAGTFDKLEHTDSTEYGIAIAHSLATIKNLKLYNSGTYEISTNNISGNAYLINPDFDNWRIQWGTVTPTIYRQYEFDLKLVDNAGTGIDTTKVKVWDKDNSLVANTNTDASGVLATQLLNYGYYWKAGGNTPVMKTPHESRVYKYGKSMLSSKSSIEAKTDWALTMLTDDHITQTTEATVAAYTGIAINHTAGTITISSNHTLDEIYDYCQYDIIAATKQLDQTMHTADGVNFVSEYSFIVNTGITVTATDQKLSMASGETYTLTGTAQFTGIIATTTTTRIPIKLTNIVNGSRYGVATAAGAAVFSGTQSGSGDVIGYYEHTTNTDIVIRVRKSSASPKYLPLRTEGTLVAAVFALRIQQIEDIIVS